MVSAAAGATGTMVGQFAKIKVINLHHTMYDTITLNIALIS